MNDDNYLILTESQTKSDSIFSLLKKFIISSYLMGI